MLLFLHHFLVFLSGNAGDRPSIFCTQVVTELAPQSLASIFNGNLSLLYQKVNNLLSTGSPALHHTGMNQTYAQRLELTGISCHRSLGMCLPAESDLWPICCPKCSYLPCALPLSVSSVPVLHSSLP